LKKFLAKGLKMNTIQNSIFNSNFSTSNPFNMNGQNSTQDLENSLMQSYARLEALKAKQNQFQNNQVQAPQATVFNDIANEFEGLSSDEAAFIVNSKEYQTLNTRYQNEFTQFLISKFSSEYIQTGNVKTLEEMLFTIRQKKDQYKQKFAEDINEIRDQNKTLVDRNNELAQSNQLLQDQLKAIQEKLNY
jgi:FtsZ-binding cell division protein ZapB